MLDEALKRKECFYKDVPLPGGLACPVVFQEEAFGIGWEWDHIGKKTNPISKLVTAGHIEDVALELEKCVLTCSFHHRLKTFEDRGILKIS